MKHIRQKDLSVYTVVLTETWIGELEQHPSILERPETFEIVDEVIPTNAQYLNYVP